MPGAFMGPFKLRELIGFACQGMMPPTTQLQSDPTRPWIPISATGILPACLHGDLVRIDADGKRVLRTVIPPDLATRHKQLATLLSPIERAKQVRAAGATAAPLASDSVKLRNQTSRKSAGSDVEQPVRVVCHEEHAGSSVPPTDARREAFGFGTAPGPARTETKAGSRRLGTGWVTPVRADFHERFGKHVRPQIAAAVLLLLACVIGLPVSYSAYKKMPLPQQQIVGNWIDVAADNSETSFPNFGIRFTENGECVLMNRTGSSWSGDFQWTDRLDQHLGFRPDGELAIQFDVASPGHEEDLVVHSDGHLRLTGLVKEAPLLDGHPVRDLFIRRQGTRLSLGYATSARWIDGERQLRAAWVHARALPPSAVTIAGTLRDLPEETPDENVSTSKAVPICLAVDNAMTGREFEHKGNRTFRHGCLTFSKQVNTGYLLKRFGAPEDARLLHEFEKPYDLNGPSLDASAALKCRS